MGAACHARVAKSGRTDDSVRRRCRSRPYREYRTVKDTPVRRREPMTMPTSEAVRLAHATDARAVADLVRRAYQHYTARIGREPAPMGADYDRAIADGTVWVVEVDDGIGGVLVL